MRRPALLIASAFALFSVAVAARPGRAQTHYVKKPETVVRAVGVYEWTGELAKPAASRFIPVSIFIDAQLQDADVYLARPIPFALATGTIFELDHAGVPDGTLDIAFARHLQATGNLQLEDTWLGYGAFKPEPKPKLTALKAGKPGEIVVSGGKAPASSTNTGTGPTFSHPAAHPGATTADDDDSSRPTLHRKDSGGSGSDSSTASSGSSSGSGSTGTQSGTTTSSGSNTGTASDSDSGRPTLQRKTDSSTASTTPDSSTGSSSDDSSRPTLSRKTDTASTTTDPASTDSDEADRPTLRRRSEADRQAARKSGNTASVTAGADLNNDPDRPTIHRGGTGADPDAIKPLEGTPADMKQRVAVSDAATRSVHDFARPWASDAERAAILARMQTLARVKLAGYDAVTGKSTTTPAAPATPAGAKSTPAKPAAASAAHTTSAHRVAPKAKPKPAPAATSLTLSDEHLESFTLSYGGDPTFVYTATATGPDGKPQYITLVAQEQVAQQTPVSAGATPDAGSLKLALASVTDGAHLDRTPWMRLVDAVDAEASNRASLLFELRAQNTRQFALYRVIGAEAEQTFTTGTTE